MMRIAVKVERLSSMLRFLLLVLAVCTYFLDPEDVIWRMIKSHPNARILEHIYFGLAAASLCCSLGFEITAIARAQGGKNKSLGLAILQNLLRALGIGSLLPLAGFLLLVSGELIITVLLHRYEMHGGIGSGTATAPWKISLGRNIGLWCACISMIIFSIVLIDRVADVLFGITGLASLVTHLRRNRSEDARLIDS